MLKLVCLLLTLSACHLFDPKPGLEMILAVETTEAAAIQQTVLTIGNRLHQAGVRGASVEARADGRLRVLLPATATPERITALLTRPARLEFRIVDETATVIRDLALPPGSAVEHRIDRRDDYHSGAVYQEYYLTAPSQQQLEATLADTPVPPTLHIRFGSDGDRARTYVVGKTELTGDFIESAETRLDEMTMSHNVFIRFDAQGARMFEKLTEENVQRKLAIVLDDTVMSAPVIQERISGGSAQVTLASGRDPRELEAEARDLASMLGGGALPAPVTVESQTVLAP